MSNSLRDARVDAQELESSLQRRERKVRKGRTRVREHGRPREARDLCSDNSAYVSRLYTSGVPVAAIAESLDEWATDFKASALVRQESAGGAADFLAGVDDRRLLLAAIDLVFVATCVGRADIARAVLTHAAIEAVPSRVLDALAIIHDVPRPASENEVLDGVYDPWLEVLNADPQKRQDAFERLVRGWRTHGEKVRSLAYVDEFFTGAWAYEAVVASAVFGLDDRAVRDCPEYPADLADYAKQADLPRRGVAAAHIPSTSTPVPPKMIEPPTRRDPASVSGEPTLAELAALLSPVTGVPLAAADADLLLDAAISAGTLVTVDARAMDPSDVTELLTIACRDLGLPAPGRGPDRVSTDPANALPALDAWLKPVGVRLLGPATDTDDLALFPVLSEDHGVFAGRTVAGLRLRTMEQAVADES